MPKSADWPEPGALRDVRALCPSAGIIWTHLLMQAAIQQKLALRIQRRRFKKATGVGVESISKALGALEKYNWIKRGDKAWRTGAGGKFCVRRLRINPKAVAMCSPKVKKGGKRQQKTSVTGGVFPPETSVSA